MAGLDHTHSQSVCVWGGGGLREWAQKGWGGCGGGWEVGGISATMTVGKTVRRNTLMWQRAQWWIDGRETWNGEREKNVKLMDVSLGNGSYTRKRDEWMQENKKSHSGSLKKKKGRKRNREYREKHQRSKKQWLRKWVSRGWLSQSSTGKKIFKAILTLKIKKTFLSPFLFLLWELLMNKLILRFLFFCFEKNIRPLRYNAVITWCGRSCNNRKHVCLMWYWSSHLLFLFVICVLCLFVFCLFFVVWTLS